MRLPDLFDTKSARVRLAQRLDRLIEENAKLKDAVSHAQEQELIAIQQCQALREIVNDLVRKRNEILSAIFAP